METILIVFHVLMAAALIGVVLLQRGAGATAGAAFGAGASGTVFGARGSANFLTRMTTGLAIGFFTISMTMAVLAARGLPQQQAEDDLGVLAPAPQAEQTVEEAETPDDEGLVFPEAPDAADEESVEFPEAPETGSDQPVEDGSIPDEEPPL